MAYHIHIIHTQRTWNMDRKKRNVEKQKKQESISGKTFTQTASHTREKERDRENGMFSVCGGGAVCGCWRFSVSIRICILCQKLKRSVKNVPRSPKSRNKRDFRKYCDVIMANRPQSYHGGAHKYTLTITHKKRMEPRKKTTHN